MNRYKLKHTLIFKNLLILYDALYDSKIPYDIIVWDGAYDCDMLQIKSLQKITLQIVSNIK